VIFPLRGFSNLSSRIKFFCETNDAAKSPVEVDVDKAHSCGLLELITDLIFRITLEPRKEVTDDGAPTDKINVSKEKNIMLLTADFSNFRTQNFFFQMFKSFTKSSVLLFHIMIRSVDGCIIDHMWEHESEMFLSELFALMMD
jgi:hypothetical protein